MAILVGAHAPDFTLRGWHAQHVSEFTLSEQLGHPVVLAFYPTDEGVVCTRQLCSYSDDLSDARLRGATLWGISPQSVESHRTFASGHELQMPLLSDQTKDVARAVRHPRPARPAPLGVRHRRQRRGRLAPDHHARRDLPDGCRGPDRRVRVRRQRLTPTARPTTAGRSPRCSLGGSSSPSRSRPRRTRRCPSRRTAGT